MHRHIIRRWRQSAALAGILFANGCLARLERGVDQLLAPDALENTIAAPYSPISGWIQFFAQQFRG